MKSEIIDLQNDFALQGIMDSKNVIAYYKELSVEQYPNLVKFGKRYASLFGSTYQCEMLFSKMKYAKNKFRSSMTDKHLNDILIVANNRSIEN